MAERERRRGWRQITYAELLRRATSRPRCSRAAFRPRSRSSFSPATRSIMLVAFGALYAGIPFCPVSPAYSLVSRDYGKLAI
jgi:feruloyl-CoA synthase